MLDSVGKYLIIYVVCGSLEDKELIYNFGSKDGCKSEDFFQEVTSEWNFREEEV